MFDHVSDANGTHAPEGDDRITPKIEALKGCHLLFCLAIGGPSAAKAVAAKIHPIKVPAVQPLEAVLERTRAMLAGTPGLSGRLRVATPEPALTSKPSEWPW